MCITSPSVRDTHAAAATAPLWFLHCSGSGPRQWRALLGQLPAGVRSVTPALLGYESSAGWHNASRALTLADEARALEPLLDAEPDGVHLVGHSYGGAVALELALRRPAQVRSLTLYEPVRFALLRSDDTRDDWRAITAVGRGIVALAGSGEVEAAARVFVDYWSGVGSWEALPPHARKGIQLRMPKVCAEFEALFDDRTPLAACGALRMPLRLLVGGRSPRPAQRVVDRLARLCPHAETVRLPELGHMGPIEQPHRLLPHLPGGSREQNWALAA